MSNNPIENEQYTENILLDEANEGPLKYSSDDSILQRFGKSLVNNTKVLNYVFSKFADLKKSLEPEETDVRPVTIDELDKFSKWLTANVINPSMNSMSKRIEQYNKENDNNTTTEETTEEVVQDSYKRDSNTILQEDYLSRYFESFRLVEADDNKTDTDKKETKAEIRKKVLDFLKSLATSNDRFTSKEFKEVFGNDLDKYPGIIKTFITEDEDKYRDWYKALTQSYNDFDDRYQLYMKLLDNVNLKDKHYSIIKAGKEEVKKTAESELAAEDLNPSVLQFKDTYGTSFDFIKELCRLFNIKKEDIPSGSAKIYACCNVKSNWVELCLSGEVIEKFPEEWSWMITATSKEIHSDEFKEIEYPAGASAEEKKEIDAENRKRKELEAEYKGCLTEHLYQTLSDGLLFKFDNVSGVLDSSITKEDMLQDDISQKSAEDLVDIFKDKDEKELTSMFNSLTDYKVKQLARTVSEYDSEIFSKEDEGLVGLKELLQDAASKGLLESISLLEADEEDTEDVPQTEEELEQQEEEEEQEEKEAAENASKLDTLFKLINEKISGSSDLNKKSFELFYKEYCSKLKEFYEKTTKKEFETQDEEDNREEEEREEAEQEIAETEEAVEDAVDSDATDDGSYEEDADSFWERVSREQDNIIVESTEEETNGSPLKSHHKCSICGNTLDSCTCKIDGLEEDESDTKSSNDSNTSDGEVNESMRLTENGLRKPYINVMSYDEFISCLKEYTSKEDLPHHLKWLDYILKIINSNPKDVVICAIDEFNDMNSSSKIANMSEIQSNGPFTAYLCAYLNGEDSYKYVMEELNNCTDIWYYFPDISSANNWFDIDIDSEMGYNNLDIEDNVPVITEDFDAGSCTQPSDIGQHKVCGVDAIGMTGKTPDNVVDDAVLFKGYHVVKSKLFPDEYEVYLKEKLVWGDKGTIQDGISWVNKYLE